VADQRCASPEGARWGGLSRAGRIPGRTGPRVQAATCVSACCPRGVPDAGNVCATCRRPEGGTPSATHVTSAGSNQPLGAPVAMGMVASDSCAAGTHALTARCGQAGCRFSVGGAALYACEFQTLNKDSAPTKRDQSDEIYRKIMEMPCRMRADLRCGSALPETCSLANWVMLVLWNCPNRHNGGAADEIVVDRPESVKAAIPNIAVAAGMARSSRSHEAIVAQPGKVNTANPTGRGVGFFKMIIDDDLVPAGSVHGRGTPISNRFE